MRRPTIPTVSVLVAAAALAFLAGPVAAEDTRAARIAARQTEKAKALHPFVPDKAERLVNRVEKALTSQPPVYAWFGSVYRGGWIAAGPGVRHRFGGTGLLDAHAAWSLRNYKLVDTSVRLPSLAANRVTITGEASWIDAPKVAYYGVGNDSPGEDERVRFEYRPTSAGARADARVAGPLVVGGSVGYLRVESDASSREPFGASAVLFDSTPSWVHTTAFAEVDWRPSPRYARRGGFWRVSWADYAQQAGTGFAFRQIEAEAAQLIPILRENWIIALRARVTTTDTGPGNEVPFYLMPSVGGGSSLRGYHSWRFRDRNALLLNAEYRWTPSHYLDMALFVDGGQVAARPEDLHLSRLHGAYGIGARFHTPSSIVLRIDVGHSREGTTLHWSTSHRF